MCKTDIMHLEEIVVMLLNMWSKEYTTLYQVNKKSDKPAGVLSLKNPTMDDLWAKKTIIEGLIKEARHNEIIQTPEEEEIIGLC